MDQLSRVLNCNGRSMRISVCATVLVSFTSFVYTPLNAYSICKLTDNDVTGTWSHSAWTRRHVHKQLGRGAKEHKDQPFKPISPAQTVSEWSLYSFFLLSVHWPRLTSVSLHLRLGVRIIACPGPENLSLIVASDLFIREQ